MNGSGLFSRIHDFFLAPLKTSPRDILLIVGLVMIGAYMWTRVLRGIEGMI